MTDIEIARGCLKKDIKEIAGLLNIPEDNIDQYGKYKAKIDTGFIKSAINGKLVLVTAITPTPAGEGKTTVAIGLADALRRLGKNAVVAMREPSMGPVFGLKGGATGGGYAQVVPMEDINLHFTGDIHAMTSAANLLAAMLDNHIQQGNALDIDVKQICWKRALDVNDRQLRNVIDGLGGKAHGVPREDGFEITVASEIMAIMCLASDLKDLKARLARIIVAFDRKGNPVTAHDIKAEGAMTALLKDALKPNLVQTMEGTPAFVHGGPFANIAHGCNSVIATKTALALSDYTITEAGFAADLGAEKFFDIKCRLAGLNPAATVIVATVRALKYHGGVPEKELKSENLEALAKGIPNLLRHAENITKVFNMPCTVAINVFPGDTQAELELVKNACKENGINAIVCKVWEKGGEGGIDLAKEVISLTDKNASFTTCYDLEQSVEDKISSVCKKVYRAENVTFTANAKKQLDKIKALGYEKLPVCIAKTQKSFSDDPNLLGAPTGFTVTVRDLTIRAGAGFITALTGDILTMPGLPRVPAAENIDVDENGVIYGLF